MILATAALVAAPFAALSTAIALLTRKEATMIAVANFIGLPLLFLSSTLIAINQIPHWIQVTASYNPVNWGVTPPGRWCCPGRTGPASASTSACCSR